MYNKKEKKSISVPAYCNYSVIDRMRSVRVQASYQIIAVETGEIVSPESLAEDKVDGCTWIVINNGTEKLIPQALLDRQLLPELFAIGIGWAFAVSVLPNLFLSANDAVPPS